MLETTKTWLTRVLQSYPNKDRIFIQVESLLSEFPGILIKTDKFQDGQILFCCHGTIQIMYKNTNYNIPIAVWIPFLYPKEAPYAFVTPTPNMLIKSSKHVDANGKIYHPMLAYWNDQQSNLSLLLKTLQSIFSIEPPVYSKPQKAVLSSQIPSSTSSSSIPSRPLPSVQHGHTSSLPSLASPVPSTHGSTTVPSSKVHAFKQESLARALTDKISQHSNELANKLSASVERQLAFHKQLTENAHKLEAYMSRIQSDKSHLERNIQILSNGNTELRRIISEIQNMPPIDVDALASQQPILFNQLYELVSEDRAIDDVLYQFTKLYSTDKMELSLFIKTIRSLAREQFMKRALIKKIRLHVGLKSI